MFLFTQQTHIYTRNLNSKINFANKKTQLHKKNKSKSKRKFKVRCVAYHVEREGLEDWRGRRRRSGRLLLKEIATSFLENSLNNFIVHLLLSKIKIQTPKSKSKSKSIWISLMVLVHTTSSAVKNEPTYLPFFPFFLAFFSFLSLACLNACERNLCVN